MPYRDVISYADPLPQEGRAALSAAAMERRQGEADAPVATGAPPEAVARAAQGGKPGAAPKAQQDGPARDLGASARKAGPTPRPGAQPGAGRELNACNPSRRMRGASDHQADGQCSSHQAR